MRRRGKVDANQQQIVDALRKCGATVHSLASLGDGMPDLLVGFRGQTVLVEVKDGAKPPSQQKLTFDQEQWQAGWRGSPVFTINGIPGAVSLLKKFQEI